jgi:hypothetical protein
MAELLLEPAPPSAAPSPARAIVGSVPAPKVAAVRPAATALPPTLLAHLLRQVASMPIERMADLLPALRILALVLASAVVLRITAATLDAIDGVPLVGGLLQLVGLVSALSFLSRQALRQQKRAELMVRIDQLRRDLLG